MLYKGVKGGERMNKEEAKSKIMTIYGSLSEELYLGT